VNPRTRRFLASRISSDDSRRLAEEVFAGDGPDNGHDDLEEVLDRSLLEAAQRLDPQASLEGDLSAHLTGRSVGQGSIDWEAAQALLGPLRAEVVAAAPAHPDLARMELVAITSGSVVLHFRPAVSVMPADVSSEIPSAYSVVDGAVGAVMHIHDQLEQGVVAAEIASGASLDLLKATRRLVEAMDKFDLELELGWRSSTGRRRRSALTARGREHAGRVFDSVKSHEEIVRGGRIIEMGLSGHVKLKQGTKAAFEVYVPEEKRSLLEELRLGQQVTFRLEHDFAADRVGIPREDRYTFIERAGDLSLSAEDV
jgi:hypothetical protein